MIGIIQEQHPDRCRLFMQWKKMGWPVMVDALNLLEVSAVPITLLIDEYGIIRAIRPRQKSLQQFLEKTYDKPIKNPPEVALPPDINELKQADLQTSPDALRVYADAVFLWGDESNLGQAIDFYLQSLKKNPEDAATHFHLGVAYRKRYDSAKRQENDFQNAIKHWAKALDINPNQYIYRRRIQQFGPRLDKPYSFYDWVTEARQDIRLRGELPVPLIVEPDGAEFARPVKQFTSIQIDNKNPDPHAKITFDEGRFIKIEATIIPSTISAGASTRIHLTFQPNQKIKAQWNNEVDNLVLWADPPQGWQVDSRYHTVPNPKQTTSMEMRKIEFEVKSPPDIVPGTFMVPCYALYYVCEGINGTCLYRRQNLSLQIKIRERDHD